MALDARTLRPARLHLQYPQRDLHAPRPFFLLLKRLWLLQRDDGAHVRPRREDKLFDWHVELGLAGEGGAPVHLTQEGERRGAWGERRWAPGETCRRYVEWVEAHGERAAC